MFLVTDFTGAIPFAAPISDARTVRDLVMGISGNKKTGVTAYKLATIMQPGDEYVQESSFSVKCITPDNTSEQMFAYLQFFMDRMSKAGYDGLLIGDLMFELFNEEELALSGQTPPVGTWISQ